MLLTSKVQLSAVNRKQMVESLFKKSAGFQLAQAALCYNADNELRKQRVCV